MRRRAGRRALRMEPGRVVLRPRHCRPAQPVVVSSWSLEGRVESLRQDLRLGLRLLWKDKAFTFTAALTLAVCIGANTALFSVVNSVLLRRCRFPSRTVSL
jgi:hypothetical protein